MTKLKRIFNLIYKMLLTVLISFLLLEFLLLAYNDVVFRRSFFQYDPDMGYKVRPYVQWEKNITNEFGFNDRDYPHQREPGTYRILVLGDSFNWAGGLQGNYASILERKFEAEFGDGRVEVINAGYSGTHTGEQLQALKKFGLQYAPDLVILGFFVGNDFFDATPWRKRIVVGNSTFDIDIRKDPEITLFGQPVVLQSRLYLFLQEQWQVYQFARNRQSSQIQQLTEGSTQATQPDAYTLDNISETLLEVQIFRMQVANSALASYAADEFRLHEEFVFCNLQAMRDLLADEGIQFMVVAYPDSFQVDESLRQTVATYYELDTSTYQLDRPQGRLWQFATELNIEFYDMLPSFQEAYEQGQRLYIHNDTHWNEAGNELAAQYLFDVLIWKAREHLN